MFPIPWNFPFRKKDGSLGKIEDLGGSYILPTASADTKGGVKIGSGLTMTGEVLSADGIPTASAETKGGVKIGSGLTMTEEVLSADAQVPAHTSAEEGKVLSVDNDGLLEWKSLSAGAKIYYKDFNKNFGSDRVLASFADGAAASSGIHIADFSSSSGGNDINIQGYTPISGIAIDKYTGYAYGVFIQMMGNNAQYGYQCTFAIGSREIVSGGLGIRVFYVKNEDLISLNS